MVDAILKRLPASSRSAYAKTMASVRNQYHVDESIRRRQLVEATLAQHRSGSAIHDALKITEGGTIAMRSKGARKERRAQLVEFLKNHCVKGLPGTVPFIQGLYAVLYLQGLGLKKGGAGKRRVEWEVQVEVFTESGGDAWTEDAVKILKSVRLIVFYFSRFTPLPLTNLVSAFDPGSGIYRSFEGERHSVLL